MLTRRTTLATIAVLALAAGVAGFEPEARAQSAEQAAAFIDQTGKQLVGIVNSPGSPHEKRGAMDPIIDHAVDVDEVARFCLGRFWRTATPEQQREYIELFHRVLQTSITSKIGEYRGVSYIMGRTLPHDRDFVVGMTLNRPNNPPSKVEWLVSYATGTPKIVDMIAEGTSLRLTQRSDYASYLSRNNNSVQALIDAMRRQVTQAG